MACTKPMDTDPPEDDISQYLNEAHLGVTILALRMSSRKKLGLYLNMEALPLPNGQLPNYGGLAECIGFEYIEQMKFERDKDPTHALLMEWGNRMELKPTLGNLVRYLLELERLDVLEDCKNLICNDAEHYLKRKAAGSSEISPLQDSTVSQSPFNIDDMDVDETSIMTIQDVESGGPTFYDAFVCYHPEGEDLDFVKAMIKKMECPPHNLKLFVPHRDDLPGASKHVISAKLIQERCKRMVIVMSPRYLRSDACDFQTKFAHALSPGSRSKKLVPVLVKHCKTPNILQHVTMCDYTRGDMTGWFWDRLIKSVQAPLNPEEISIANPKSLSGLQMSVESKASSFTSVTAPLTVPASSSRGEQVPRSVTCAVPDNRSATASASALSQGACGSGLFSSLRGSSESFSSVDGDSRMSPKKSKAHTVAYAQSSSASPGSSSPNADRKTVSKKKSLKSKLTSILSSSSHSSSL